MQSRFHDEVTEIVKNRRDLFLGRIREFHLNLSHNDISGFFVSIVSKTKDATFIQRIPYQSLRSAHSLVRNEFPEETTGQCIDLSIASVIKANFSGCIGTDRMNCSFVYGKDHMVSFLEKKGCFVAVDWAAEDSFLSETMKSRMLIYMAKSVNELIMLLEQVYGGKWSVINPAYVAFYSDLKGKTEDEIPKKYVSSPYILNTILRVFEWVHDKLTTRRRT